MLTHMVVWKYLPETLTHEQIFKNLPKVLAAKAIRMKDEIHRVVQERFQPTKEERPLILKTMQEGVAPERAVIRNMVDKYRQLGGPEKYLMETLARAFLGTAKFQIDQRTDLSQEKRRESIRKLKGLRPQASKSA